MRDENRKEVMDKIEKLFTSVSVKFIPDKIETTLVREGELAKVTYREYFTYLPDDIWEWASEVTLLLAKKHFLSGSGIDMKISRIEGGVEAVLTGHPLKVIGGPLIEFLMFANQSRENIVQTLDDVMSVYDRVLIGKVQIDLSEDQETVMRDDIISLKILLGQRGLTLEEYVDSLLDS